MNWKNVLICALPCLTCMSLAGLILVKYGPEASGWGWLLFASLLLAPSWHDSD